MKVSVIVPVYNSGRGVASLVASLAEQSLASEDWEAIFVDDGSSDGTPEVVEELIGERPNMRLIREPRSGWPGRPRNVGLDAARGEYVFFSDDDDTLGPEALERMVAFAAEHDADVVIPRTVGVDRSVPAITRTVVDAQEEPALIMSSLAPHKLFKRAFLLSNDIRFVEGPFRLEDHLFVVTAYLRARRVSTYADYPVYYLHFRPKRAHISKQATDWSSYFGSVRACLDRVDAEAKDERTARVMRSRWLRVEGLARLRGDSYEKLASPDLMREVGALIRDRYGDEDLAALKPLDRMYAVLLADHHEDRIEDLARWEAAVAVTSTVTDVQLSRTGVLTIQLRSALSSGPPPMVEGGDEQRYPTEQALLDQVAGFTKVGAELLHTRTKTRRPFRVVQNGDGRTTAELKLAGEPLAGGSWTLLALAGEHRTRRRRPVEIEPEAVIPAGHLRVGDRRIAFVVDQGLHLEVTRAVATPMAALLMRVERRLRRALAPRR
jgi:glycosyltransferase involved in cell wall biosynthesis